MFLSGSIFAQAIYPKIYSVTHNGAGKTLAPGDKLTVVLRGESGGIATFDITTVVMDVPMQEAYPGKYIGTYTIPAGRQIPFASVAGHLRLNDSESRLVALRSVVIWDNTLPVSDNSEVSPAPGSQTTSVRPFISVYFSNPIQVSSVDLTIDGNQYADQANITPNSVSVTPVYNLSPGAHHVIISAIDTTGQRILREWNFYVANYTGAK